jgi:hypothetical protein
MPFACAICCLTERERESQPLPIYDVGWCDLGINGKSCRTRFKSAALSPFDVILGESWLREHRVVLDYADNRLWQKDVEGNLRPLTFEGVRSDRNHDVRKHADIGGGAGASHAEETSITGVFRAGLPTGSVGFCQGAA